jgi:hypothetical protein
MILATGTSGQKVRQAAGGGRRAAPLNFDDASSSHQLIPFLFEHET